MAAERRSIGSWQGDLPRHAQQTPTGAGAMMATTHPRNQDPPSSVGTQGSEQRDQGPIAERPESDRQSVPGKAHRSAVYGVGTQGSEQRGQGPIDGQSQLVLASASPARRALLAAAGIDAEIVVSGVDESAVDAMSAEALCSVLARLKAHAVAERLRQRTPPPVDVLVLGCDSVLAFDGQILGKPDSAEDAIKRWHSMRGRSGILLTGHCLVDLRTGSSAEGVGSTVVHFADISDAEVDAYVATGEPLRVAGAFTIDGLGGPFIERIEGDHGNVVGLSLPVLREMLMRLGRSITDLWRTE